MGCFRTLVLMILAFVASFGVVLGVLLLAREVTSQPEDQRTPVVFEP